MVERAVVEKVRAAVKLDAGTTEVQQFDLPTDIPEDAALLRVEAAGV